MPPPKAPAWEDDGVSLRAEARAQVAPGYSLPSGPT